MAGERFTFYLDRGSHDLVVHCTVHRLLAGLAAAPPISNHKTAEMIDPGAPGIDPEVELDLLDENGHDISDLITAEEDDWIQRKVMQKLGEQ